VSPETHYRFELDKYLGAIRAIKAPISDYREALETAIEDLQMELESLGDPDDDLDMDEGDSR
jgi:hypothetical protein